MNFIKTSTINNFTSFFLFLLAAMPLMPNGILSVTIIVYVFLCYISYLLRPISINRNDKKYLFAQIGFYLFFLLSFFYSEDKDAYFRIIQHSITILIFPFLSLINKGIDKNQLKKIVIIFISSSGLLSVYIAFSLFYTYGISAVFRTSIVSHMVRENFFYLDIHPIYTSIYFAFSFFLIFNYLINNLTFKNILFYLPISAIFILGIVILASKIIMLIFLFSIIYVLIINKKKSKGFKLKLFIFITSMTLIIFFNVKTIHSRFSDLFNTFFSDNLSAIKSNSTYIRKQIYNCCLKVSEDNLLFGVGVGDVQKHLFECYKFEGFDITSISAHNFYLRILLSCGFLPLLLFVYSIYVLVKQSLLDKNEIYFFFISSFIVIMLVEDYLLRAYGVILYTIVNHIFYVYKKGAKCSH